MQRLLKSMLCVIAVLPAQLALAAMDDDPVIYAVKVDELEWRDTDNASGGVAWNVEAWAGRDLNKLMFKTEGERDSQATEEFETQLLWRRAVAPFWDLELGWRRDWQPATQRDWFAFGLAGTAPGFIKTEITAFVGEDSNASVRVKAAYEIMLSQRLKLEPKVEANWFSDADPANELGRGLASVEVGLRLAYAVRRNLKPYVGVNWEKLSGSTADFARSEGESDSELQAVAGLKWMF